MISRIFLGSKRLDDHSHHEYFVELIDGPHDPLYVHAQEEVRADGSIRAMISYCPLADAIDQPYHAQARSAFMARRTRV